MGFFCPNKTFTIPDFKKTREQLVYGYFYSADSLKIFVKTERHSLIRLAEVGSAFSFKWVLRQIATMMSKLKKLDKVAVLPSEVTIREILAAFVPEP